MNSRLRDIAAVNARIVATGEYSTPYGTVRVGPALHAAMSGTVGHPPDEPLAPHPVGAGPSTQVRVTGEGSLQAARRLSGSGSGPIAVLNFASARNPGGGYLRGARAQEEDLCRNSLLYPCLLRAPDYYAAHRAGPDLLYSDRVIWSPDVPVHRDEHGRLLDEPFPVSFLTCAAPDAGETLQRDPAAHGRVRETLRRRAGRVLTVAHHHGARRLVLGAWGCGVFRNDPREVAGAFHDHLAPDGAFAAAFEHVVFAIHDPSPDSPNRTAFTERFGAAEAARR
ncbi:TIGR02452 family protein [Embleya sp. NPDC059237]|uniref:TIGR02452 family protein n=1 Tax=Embleya sp. NPDC059237 TaxID=3346784 RepID=UPI003699B650